MKILKFKLSGRTAFFKKPDVNSYLYFTYGNIHKLALLGIFGAILGYKGYNQMDKKDDFPEFYHKLKDIKISIVPNNKKGFIPKKVQTYNNSVGYASQEQGGNLIIKEQWLENPSWDIYLIINDEESKKIAEYLINNKAIYQPYLGKNDHYANISEVNIIEDSILLEINKANKIDSLCPKKLFEVDIDNEEEEDDDEGQYNQEDEHEDTFKYEEQLPIGLDKDTAMYIMEGFLYTNMNVISQGKSNVYKIKNKNIVFY